ncbi:MAG: class I SAM-dependent methyltransferase [Pirellulales bacterium]|nr:class I SAM-dependent methyltransferase [Pirellulales bacterium]
MNDLLNAPAFPTPAALDALNPKPRRPGAKCSAADREREFFDKLVAEEAEFNPFTPQGWETLARRFEKMVPLTGAVRMLDVGCGTGQSRQIYRLAGLDYTGLDLSGNAVQRARQKYPRDEWICADACNLPFAGEQFDLVAFSSVLHHVPDYRLPLAEAFRVLRPGGRAFAFDPNLLHPAMALFRHPHSPLYRPEGVSPNERPLLPRALAQAFRAAGFREIRQRCQAGISYRAVAPKEIRAFLKLYNFADRLLQFSGFGQWFGTFILTTGKKPVTKHILQ